MKKLFITAIAVLALVSCSEQSDLVTNVNETNLDAISGIRTPQEAVEAAQSALMSLNPTSRSSQLVKGVDDVQPIYSTTSRSENNAPVMYVVPCEEEGFVLVSAPVNAPDVLAIVEEGDFNSEETLNNEGFQQHLNSTITLISRLPINPIPVTPVEPIEIGKMDTTDVYKKAEKRLAVEWDQGWPEGLYAPNKIAGCVPVGIAQMMSYFALPTTITYTYPGHTLNSETINWNAIKKHSRSCHNSHSMSDINQHYAHCQATEGAHLMLARLCRQIGVYANAAYNDSSTTVHSDYVIPTLNKYLPGKSITTITNQAKLQEQLLTGGIAGVGMMPENINAEGHFWIADGAWTYGRIITYTGPEIRETPPDQPIDPIVTFEMSNTVKDYVHYNWGWGGNCNGYFLVGINKPQKAYLFDNSGFGNSSKENFTWGYLSFYMK